MSTAPVPGWDEDDLMAVANAAGVNPATNPAASIRTTYTDAEYAAVLANWSRQAAPPFTVDMSIDADTPIDLLPVGALDEATSTWVTCSHCADTGIVGHRSALTGVMHFITCPICGGVE
jgi:hypothetical protein